MRKTSYAPFFASLRIADTRKKDSMLKLKIVNFFSYIYYKLIAHETHNYTKVYPKCLIDFLLLSIIRHKGTRSSTRWYQLSSGHSQPFGYFGGQYHDSNSYSNQANICFGYDCISRKTQCYHLCAGRSKFSHWTRNLARWQLFNYKLGDRSLFCELGGKFYQW